MRTLNEIVKKVNSLKKQLQNKQVYENFGDKQMGKLDDFIGDIYEYDYHRRQSIFEIKEDFFNWCSTYTGRLALARKYSRHANIRPNNGVYAMKTKDKFIDVLPNGKRVEMGIDKNNMYYGEIRDKQGNFEAGTLALSSSEVHNWIYDHCDLLCPVFEIE